LTKRIFLAFAVSVLAGCGGGGGSAPPVHGPAPQQPAVASAAPLPASTTTAVSFNGSSSATTFPALSNGISSTVTLPATSSATGASLTYEAALPSGVTAPSASLRQKASIGGTNLTALGFFAFTVTSTVTTNSTFGFSFASSVPITGTTYIAYFDANNPANGWNVLLGPGAVLGDAITFAPQPAVPPVTYVKGDTYFFALVESSTAVAAASTYTGTKTVNYSYGYAFGYPQPGPTATAPPTTLTYTVASTVTAGSASYPGPNPSASPLALTDVNVAETDSGALSGSTYTTDSWVGETLTNGSYALSLYGTLQQEPTSAELPTYSTIYGTPQLLDVYPETSTSWSTNSPAAAITYGFADGDAGTRTVNADGSYLDTETLINTPGNTVTLTENSDGSGSIVGPYYGGDIISSIAFSAPSGGSNSAVTTTISYTPDAQSYYGFPPSEAISDPTWYTIPPLYSETDTVTLGATLPAGCATTFGTTGTEVQRVMTTIDTVIGDIETTTLSSYAISNIPVCLVSNDVVNYAYDEENNTPYLILIGQLGTEVVTTNETLNLQSGASGSLPAAKGRSATSVVPGPGGALSLVALENHELTSFAKARVVHEHAFLAGMKSRATASFKAIHGGVR